MNEQSTIVSQEYAILHDVLMSALDQAANGKGRERHAGDKPFREQTIFQTAEAHGLGFLTGQAEKKGREAHTLLKIKGPDAAERELLGAINYIAAAIVLVREQGELKEAGYEGWTTSPSYGLSEKQGGNSQEKSCSTCKYDDSERTGLPCPKVCIGHREWEPKAQDVGLLCKGCARDLCPVSCLRGASTGCPWLIPITKEHHLATDK